MADRSGFKLVFWRMLFWFVFVLLGVLLFFVFLWPENHGDVYEGVEVRFEVRGSGYDWQTIEIQPNARIYAASNHYFLFTKGSEHLFGTPIEPPLGYESDLYFHLESEIESGEWEFIKGKVVDIKLIGSTPLRVELRPGILKAVINVLVTLFMWAGLSFAAWVFLFMKPTKEARKEKGKD